MRILKKLLSDRFYNFVFLGVASLLLLWSCAVMVYAIAHANWMNYVDYLYNYGGGFIRRGLTGEILFLITDLTGIPPLITSYLLSILGYLIVAWFVIVQFRKKGYALNVLIMGFMLGGIFILSINEVRRDYIEMAIFIGIMTCYRKFTLTKWVLCSNVCSVVAILLHEAVFFFMIPILILVTNIKLKNLIKSVCMWLPSVFVFLLCCYYKGSQEMLPAICEPIRVYAPEVFDNGDVPWLLSFIGKDTEDVLRLHIRFNFTQPFSRYLLIPAAFITLFYWVYIPYITICMIKVFNENGLSNSRQKSLFLLIIFQFIVLLPMFTLLSCDILRVSIYWILSSTIVWLVLTDGEIDAMFLSRFNDFGRRITVCCFNRRLPGKMALTLCMLFIGICNYSRTPVGILYDAPAAKLVYIGKKIIESITL